MDNLGKLGAIPRCRSAGVITVAPMRGRPMLRTPIDTRIPKGASSTRCHGAPGFRKCNRDGAGQTRGRGHAGANAASTIKYRVILALSRRKQGSSPLGSGNDFNDLVALQACGLAASPTFLQCTVPPKIGSRPPRDRRLEEAEEIGAATAYRHRCLLSKDDPRSHRGALRGAN